MGKMKEKSLKRRVGKTFRYNNDCNIVVDFSNGERSCATCGIQWCHNEAEPQCPRKESNRDK